MFPQSLGQNRLDVEQPVLVNNQVGFVGNEKKVAATVRSEEEFGGAEKLSCESRHNQYTREQLRPGLFYTLFSRRWKARALDIHTDWTTGS